MTRERAFRPSVFVVHLKRAPYKKVEFSFPKEGEKEEKIDCKNPKLKSTVKP